MIKSLGFEKEKDNSEKKVEKKKEVRKSSSKVMVFFGFLLLLFILGTMGVKIMHAQKQKPSKSVQNTEILQKELTQGAQGFMSEALETSGGIGEILIKAGQEAGGAILGASVKFMGEKASESAPGVASAAANLVIQSTVPALINQIEKLPKDQQNEIKKMICE